MMIFGIAATGITAGLLLDPYSPATGGGDAGVVALALTFTTIGVWGQERLPARERKAPNRDLPSPIAREFWADPRVRNFTIFVFVSM
jgi:BCD family chlorophyll transporter-like MFS transporter